MRASRRASVFVGIVLLSLALNLLLDSSNCFVGQCLTKHSAFRDAYVGMSSAEVAMLLQRAGINADRLAGKDCQTVMFSDFWRDYLIQRDQNTGTVVRKAFAFRQHGKGLAEFLRLAR